MPRLFVAVWPPEHVLDAIDRLPRLDESGVRWTDRRHWHITLRFFGEAETVDAIAALSIVEGAPAEVVLGPQVTNLGRNVVCIPGAGLDALAIAVRDVTAHVGEPPDPRPFSGHITLARLNHRASCNLAGTDFDARFDVDEVHLVESTLGPGGPAYETVFLKPLSG